MKMRPFRLLLNHILTAGIILAICPGILLAAVDEKAAGSDAISTLKAIIVSADAYQAEISADTALTYTFYKASKPARAVIDLAQTEPGGLGPQEVNAGKIKRINVTKHSFGGGFLTRVEMVLSSDDEFTVTTDPTDKNKLLVSFKKPEVQPEQPVVASPAQPEAVKPQVEAPETKQNAEVNTQPVANEAQPTPAPEQPTASAKKGLTAIDIQKDGVEIKIAGGIESFKSFVINKPERLVVDLPGVRSFLQTNTVDINSFGITKARIGVTPEKVRLVFDTKNGALQKYDVQKTDTGLRIVFLSADDEVKNEVAVVSQSAKESEPTPVKLTAKVPSTIEGIDFEVKGDNSQITITVGGACVPGKPAKVAKGLTLNFKNCLLPRKLQRFIDTSAFASAVKGITPYPVKGKTGKDTRIMVQLRSSDTPNSIKQEGDKVVWEIRNTVIPPRRPDRKVVEAAASRPKASAVEKHDKTHDEIAAVETGTTLKIQEVVAGTSAKMNNKKVYTGRKVSLEFSDADVRKIFQLIAEVSGLNFLISDDVTGTISIKLVNVPWDHALDVIMDSKGLEMKRDDNIVQIKPRGRFRTLEQEEADARKAKDRAMPLITEIFDINFSNIADVEKQFNSLKSERGVIAKDERTNRIVVKDIQPAIDGMRFLLKTIDLPEKQVLIEARIVEASSTFTRDLGVQWDMHFKDGSASIANVNRMDSGWGGILTVPIPTSGSTSSNQGAGGSMGLSFGKLTDNVQLNLRLAAAAVAGHIKIISSPKVVTLNNKAAKISQGQALYIPTTSAEGTRFDRIDATLSLEVKPHITTDGNIIMAITAKNDSPGAPPPGATLSVNKKEANTELLVKNGETTVIGGIYVDNDTDSNAGVPFLMDIPLLGWMFKSNFKQKIKTELLIFITPRIVS